MKKLRIIMPTILVAPILFGCQNKNTYSFTFHSDYCTLDNKSEYSKKETEPITLNMKLKEGYEYCEMPDDIVVIFGKGAKDTNYDYKVNDDKKGATITLTVTANITVTAQFSDSDNNFRIDPNKFDEAVGLTGKDMKYVQRMNLKGYMTEWGYQLIYFESYISPTVYNEYSKNIYGQYQSTSNRYIEKAGNKYYRYDKETSSSPWQKKETTETEFIKPTDASIKRIAELKNINYNLIENKYNKESQSYEFETEAENKKYDVVMSFYNNQVTFLSYSNYDESSTDPLDFETINFAYRTLTPTLPKVN